MRTGPPGWERCLGIPKRLSCMGLSCSLAASGSSTPLGRSTRSWCRLGRRGRSQIQPCWLTWTEESLVSRTTYRVGGEKKSLTRPGGLGTGIDQSTGSAPLCFICCICGRPCHARLGYVRSCEKGREKATPSCFAGTKLVRNWTEWGECRCNRLRLASPHSLQHCSLWRIGALFLRWSYSGLLENSEFRRARRSRPSSQLRDNGKNGSPGLTSHW